MIEGTLLAMFLCLEQVLFLGCFLSKKQPIVTLSSTEAKFVAFIACACQAIWLRRILEELQFKKSRATKILCDNISCLCFYAWNRCYFLVV